MRRFLPVLAQEGISLSGHQTGTLHLGAFADGAEEGAILGRPKFPTEGHRRQRRPGDQEQTQRQGKDRKPGWSQYPCQDSAGDKAP